MCLLDDVKKWKAIAAFTVTMLSSIASAIAIYPAMLNHIFSSYRGTSAFDSVSSDTQNNLSKYFDIINSSFFGGMVSYILIFLFLVIVGGVSHISSGKI